MRGVASRNAVDDIVFWQVVVDAANLDMGHYRTHNVTVSFEGGLGANMFQYAGACLSQVITLRVRMNRHTCTCTYKEV